MTRKCFKCKQLKEEKDFNYVPEAKCLHIFCKDCQETQEGQFHVRGSWITDEEWIDILAYASQFGVRDAGMKYNLSSGVIYRAAKKAGISYPKVSKHFRNWEEIKKQVESKIKESSNPTIER